MLLEISDRYRVSTDTYNWTFEELYVVKEGKTKGKEKWKAWGHWPTLKGLCRDVPNMFLMRFDGPADEGMVEVKEMVTSLYSRLLEQRALILQGLGWA